MSSTRTSPGGTARNDLIHGGERLVLRVVALMVGMILVIMGIALGVTIVLLPVGIPMTILGLVLCVAAIGLGRFSDTRKK